MNEVKEVALTYTMKETFIKKNTESHSNIKSVTVIELNKLISIIGLFTIDNKKFYDINSNLILIDGGGRVISTEDELYESSLVKDVYNDHTYDTFDDLTIDEVENSKKKPKINIKKEHNLPIETSKNNVSKKENTEKKDSVIRKENTLNNNVVKPLNKNILYVDSDIDVEIVTSKFNAINFQLVNFNSQDYKPVKIVETIGGYKIDVKLKNPKNTFINTTVTINGKTVYGNFNPKIIIYINDDIINVLDVKTVSSNIHVSSKIKKARLMSVSGSISINEVEEIIYCTSISGSINVFLNSRNTSEVYIRNTSGNIDLMIKNVSDLRLSHSTVSGKVTNNYKEDFNNEKLIKANIDLKTISGNILVKNYR